MNQNWKDINFTSSKRGKGKERPRNDKQWNWDESMKLWARRFLIETHPSEVANALNRPIQDCKDRLATLKEAVIEKPLYNNIAISNEEGKLEEVRRSFTEADVTKAVEGASVMIKAVKLLFDRDAKANGAPEDGTSDWMLDSASGYYYNQINGLHYDSKSGFYYSDSIGRWVTQDEAYAAVETSSDKGTKVALIQEAGPSMAKPPGRVVTASLNPKRTMKGAASSVDIGNNKRKRTDEKPKKVSAEEKAALRAREAARKRVEDREKPLFGLHNRPF